MVCCLSRRTSRTLTETQEGCPKGGALQAGFHVCHSARPAHLDYGRRAVVQVAEKRAGYAHMAAAQLLTPCWRCSVAGPPPVVAVGVGVTDGVGVRVGAWGGIGCAALVAVAGPSGELANYLGVGVV